MTFRKSFSTFIPPQKHPLKSLPITPVRKIPVIYCPNQMEKPPATIHLLGGWVGEVGAPHLPCRIDREKKLFAIQDVKTWCLCAQKECFRLKVTPTLRVLIPTLCRELSGLNWFPDTALRRVGARHLLGVGGICMAFSSFFKCLRFLWIKKRALRSPT